LCIKFSYGFIQNEDPYLYQEIGSQKNFFMFDSREEVGLGDLARQAKPCSLGKADVCVEFFDIVFTLPEENEAAIEKNGVNITFSKYLDYEIFGETHDLILVTSVKDKYKARFWHSEKRGIILIEFSDDIDKAVYILRGECGYASKCIRKKSPLYK
jgi:hypothetical protein